jgi:hypothetical protein
MNPGLKMKAIKVKDENYIKKAKNQKFSCKKVLKFLFPALAVCNNFMAMALYPLRER